MVEHPHPKHRGGQRRRGTPQHQAGQQADDGAMNNHVPLSILFSLLVAAVVPLAVGLYLHGHMNLAAVLKNAFG